MHGKELGAEMGPHSLVREIFVLRSIHIEIFKSDNFERDICLRHSLTSFFC
jgi:hypothetical protein